MKGTTKRLPPQLDEIKEKTFISFIRPTFDGECWLAASKGGVKAYVYKVNKSSGLVILVFTRPRMNVCRKVDKSKTFRAFGFPYCRVVRYELLIENCREA